MSVVKVKYAVNDRAAVIFNAGYKDGRISENNQKVSPSHLLSLIIFETPFRKIDKISYPNNIATRVLYLHVSLYRRNNWMQEMGRT